MSLSTISQRWSSDQDNPPWHRVWSVQLTVSAKDMTADEIAALEPVVAAIETYAALLRPREDQT